jgi:N-acetylglutamate synthase-like GNAT family acetyltransferase
MISTTYRVRRATLDDLPALQGLWESMQLPAAELEKRLTEFQVVEASDGQIAGAIGIQILRQHACLHSESFTDFGVSDQIRPLLLQRIQSLAANHGVFRLWTTDRTPFWVQQGFKPAADAILVKLPVEWKRDEPQNWLTLQLKDEEALVSLEKELALFKETERRSTARTLERARLIKTIVTVLGFTLGAILIGLAIFLLFQRRHSL